MEVLVQDQHSKEVKLTDRENIELFILIGLMLVSVIFIPALKGLMAIAPIIYFLVERRIRKRSREEIGFGTEHFNALIKKTWVLILVVGVGMQLMYLYSYKWFFPAVLEHVLIRVPLDFNDLNPMLFFTIALLAFGEEIVFRGLIQARLSKLMPVWIAIVLTSVLFAVMHIAAGKPSVIFADLLSVFIDSVLFGIIFAKSKSIYIATIAHILANTVALLSIYAFVL